MIEDDICIRFVNLVKKTQHLAEKPFVWFHVPNEVDAKRNTFAHGIRQKAKHKLSGVADYIFMWENGNACLEFKRPKDPIRKTQAGKQSESQKDFQKTCDDAKVPYYLVYNENDAFGILEDLGLYRKGKIIY